MAPRLRLFLALALTSAFSMLAAAPSTAAPRSASSSLAARVAAALRGSSAHVDYRINISGVGTISHAATRPSAPASNQKLFTTITAMQVLGPDFRYATTVSGTSAIAANGTLHGDLVLRGSGDPTLTFADLHRMAHNLHKRGLRHVTGRLIVDDTRYSHQTRVTGWKHKFVPSESGTVDAFTIDHNEWRSGASFDADPTHANAAQWRHELKKAHITTSGKTTIMASPPLEHTLLTHRSPDLTSIVDATLTDSINFDAEMMLREVGAAKSGHGTPETGVAAERAVASQLGLSLGTAYDGSGLSYADRETPATIEAWLLKLRTLPFYSQIYYALPLSCYSGTLRSRLCGPNVRRLIRAKTGTLDHNSALSGYLQTKSGHAVTFSILASGFKDSNFGRVYDHVDKALAVIAIHG